MNINPEIRKTLLQYNINEGDGTLYLLAVYHQLPDLHLVHIPEMVKKQINLTKIVERDYENEGKGKLIWNIPLYSTEIISDQWDWIEEWRGFFGKLRPDAIGSKRNCETKMKKFFANNPEIRKDDIYRATDLYLNPFRSGRQNPTPYLQKADYFISKIIKAEGGVEYGSRLEMYLEIVLKNRSEGTPDANRQLNQIVK